MDLKPGKVKKHSSAGIFNYSVIIRVVLAAVLLILANKLSIDALIASLMLIVGALTVGFDIILAAVNEVINKKFFSYVVLVVLSAIIVFCIGCHNEAVLFLIVYQLFTILLDYIKKRANASASYYISDDREDDKEILAAILAQPEASKTTAAEKLEPILDLFTKAAALVGVIYAVFMPLVSDISYITSVRCGLMLIAVASPVSVLVSLPVSAVIGISQSAGVGIFMRDANTLENTAGICSVVIDKEYVLTESAPALTSFTSPIFDNETFLRLAAHIAYYSEQTIAESILTAYKGTVYPEIVKNFKDIPGCGMEVTINGFKVSLSTREVLDTRKIEIPSSEELSGLVLYMTVAGKYAGGMQFSENFSEDAETAVADIKQMADIGIILTTENSRSLTKELADRLDIDEFICECSTDKKIGAVEYASTRLSDDQKLLYISADELEYHTVADIDATVGGSSGSADMLITSGLGALPYAYTTAKRTRTIQLENIIFAFVIKLALIIIAFAGISTLWFTVMADLVAGLLTVINTARISTPSLFNRTK